MVQKYKIKKIANATSGATESICPDQYIPRGWVIIDYNTCAGCCGRAGELVKKPTIKRIDKLPRGSKLDICPDQEVPRGWVVIDNSSCAGCCGRPGELVKKMLA